MLPRQLSPQIFTELKEELLGRGRLYFIPTKSLT